MIDSFCPFPIRPLVVGTVTVALVSCGHFNAPPNQTQRLRSPSNRYELTVPIGENPGSGNQVWQVTLRETEYGSILYKDAESDFVGNLNVYWIWDEADRVWLYNSDDGRVYFWAESARGEWIKQQWGYGRTNESGLDIEPPAALYPDYVE